MWREHSSDPELSKDVACPTRLKLFILNVLLSTRQFQQHELTRLYPEFRPAMWIYNHEWNLIQVCLCVENIACLFLKEYVIKAFHFGLGCVKEATRDQKYLWRLGMCWFIACRQWVKSEEISGLTLWFTKRGLEKQVSILNTNSTRINKTANTSYNNKLR